MVAVPGTWRATMAQGHLGVPHSEVPEDLTVEGEAVAAEEMGTNRAYWEEGTSHKVVHSAGHLPKTSRPRPEVVGDLDTQNVAGRNNRRGGKGTYMAEDTQDGEDTLRNAGEHIPAPQDVADEESYKEVHKHLQ